MAGKHRAKLTQRRQTEGYVWLGTGAVTLALGVALTGGSGVAQADTTPPGNSAATTSIRTTISAQSVNTSTDSSMPKLAGDEETATSFVSTNESVVRNQDQNPLIFHNNPGPGPTLAETVIGLNQGDRGVISGIPGLDIPFIELGGGGGGLLSNIAGALSGGML
jgi:hypothetical protein